MNTPLQKPPQAEPDTVYVVDDDEAIRVALDSLLRSLGFRVMTYGRVSDFLARQPLKAGAACLVLDVRLPDINGLDLLKASSRTAHGDLPPVIVITGHGDIPMSVRAMKAGAIEFLSKPFREADLLRAISEALATDRQQRESREAQAAVRALYSSLTPREHQVLHAVVGGLLNKQVGEQLGMSEATVKQHRAQVMRKMAVGSLADLVRAMERLKS